MPPRQLTDDEIQRALTRAVQEAVDHVAADVAPARIKAQRYVDGETDLGEEDGRSTVVATKARDTVRAVLPVLMRIFLQSGRPVEFSPSHAGAVAHAEQQTAYVESVIDRNRGFSLLYAAFWDALVKKNGIAKVIYCETPEVEVDEWSGLDVETVTAILAQDPDLEVLDYVEEADGSLSLKVSKTLTRGRIRIDAIPPETFFVSPGARSVDDFGTVIGHADPAARAGDLVAMGFDHDQIQTLAEVQARDDAEALERTDHAADADEATLDPSMRRVLFTEAYMRADRDGTGVPRLHKFLCGGPDYTILRNADGTLAVEPADENPFCNFVVDPIPHSFWGRSMVDILIEDQDAATSLLRGLIDSIHFANNPRTVILDGMVDEDSLLSNEYGSIWREKTTGAIREFALGATTPSAVLPAIQHFDAYIRAKTGVSDAAMGMGPDALRNTTATAADGILGAAQAVAELIARVLAETGMTDLARKVAALARQHPNPEEVIRVNGQFTPIDPRSWAAELEVKVNVGLGTGRHEDRVMGLMETIQAQMAAYQALGPGNPVVGLTEMRNAQADLLAARGLHNADRYWKPMNAEQEAQLLAQQAQAAQGQPQDPASLALIGAEQVKGQVALQNTQMKVQADLVKAAAKDDLERDRMAQDLALAQTQQAQQVNEARLRAEQAAARPYGPGAAQPPAR